MDNSLPKFHFLSDIKLKKSPLAEAWLEMQWELEPPDGSPNMMRDPGFPFALSAFANNIKNKFGHTVDLEASQIPQDMLPHVVRHQFRPAKDAWPLLQLGPGVASANMSKPYTWQDFENHTLYLRSNLVDAYGEKKLVPKVTILRYRNVEPFDFRSDNLLSFLSNKLNIAIDLPEYLPGVVSLEQKPTSSDIRLTFDLTVPKGTGSLRLATATTGQTDPVTGKQSQSPVFLWQLEVHSGGDISPDFYNEEEFAQWLNAAHAVIHEWFFSLIEGSLFNKYKGGGK